MKVKVYTDAVFSAPIEGLDNVSATQRFRSRQPAFMI